jgi:hypothetical protein
MRIYVTACLAAILGFAFGVLFSPTSVKAQSRAAVWIDSDTSPNIGGSTPIHGSQIVGFSCAPQDDKGVVCYIASVK